MSLVYFEIIPTKDGRLTFEAAKELFTWLHARRTADHYEAVVSTGTEGLELAFGSSKPGDKSIARQLYSLSPKLSIAKSGGRSKPTLSRYYVLNRHYAYPLWDAERTTTDPLNQLANHLAQYNAKTNLRLVLEIERHKGLRASWLRSRLLAGQQPLLFKSRLLSAISGAISLTGSFLALATRTIGQKLKPNPAIRIDNRLRVALLDKLYDPLFKVRLRLDIKAANQSRAEAIALEIDESMQSFARQAGYQSLKSTAKPTASIFSASDMAGLFHMTDEAAYKTLSYLTLPNTLSPTSRDDLIVGLNDYQGTLSKIAIGQAERERHLYIAGATGSGKSTLLANLISQDIVNGRGVSLVDPHGDLAELVLSQIPASRQADVVYFKPQTKAGSYKINLLQTLNPRGTAAFQREADQLTESLISLFRKIFSEDDSGGHRLEYILRNTIHTALTLEDSTIFTIYQLLTDPRFRYSVIAQLTNSDLIGFWRNEFGKAGDYQRVKMTAGITAKLGRFLFSEPTKRVFAATSSNLDFDQLLNQGKILICNFSKGDLGEDGSRLFATAILTKLQLAALNRSRLPITARTKHYLYIDEFQNYAPTILIQMLAEARKYGLNLTMAEQSPSQHDPKLTNSILANAASILSFRTASAADIKLLSPLFGSQVSSADLTNLPTMHFYLRTVGTTSSRLVSGYTTLPAVGVRASSFKASRSQGRARSFPKLALVH